MALADSSLDPTALAYVRALLRPRLESDGRWAALGAAAFAAVSALAFAVAMILAPPTTTTHLVSEKESITLSMTPAVR